MDRQQGALPYFPPPPSHPSSRPPPPLPPRNPGVLDDTRSQQRPPLPPRPASGSLRNWSSSLARTVSSNVKTLAREGAQAATNSSYFKQVAATYRPPTVQPQQQYQQYNDPHQQPVQQFQQQLHPLEQPSEHSFSHHLAAVPQPTHSYGTGQQEFTNHHAPLPNRPYAVTNPAEQSPWGSHAAITAQTDQYYQETHQLQTTQSETVTESGHPPQPAQYTQPLPRTDAKDPSTAALNFWDGYGRETMQPGYDSSGQINPQSYRVGAEQALSSTQAPSERVPMEERKLVADGEGGYMLVGGTQSHSTTSKGSSAPTNSSLKDHHQLQTTNQLLTAPGYFSDESASQSLRVSGALVAERPFANPGDPSPPAQHVTYHPNDQVHNAQTETSYSPNSNQLRAEPFLHDGVQSHESFTPVPQPIPTDHAISPSPAVVARKNDSISGLLRDLNSTLKNFTIKDPVEVPEEGLQQKQRWTAEDWVRPPLSFSLDGKPNPTVWDCPGSLVDSTYNARWYHLPQASGFFICTRCYQRFIAHTNLAGAFEKREDAIGRCRFNVPRITTSLLPQCQETGDIQPLIEFFQRRLSIKDCRGPGGTTGKDDFKWFIIDRKTNDTMVNYVSCEACYEDILRANASYGHEFIPRADRYSDRLQGSDEVWICDTSFGFVRRCFEVYTRNGIQFTAWVDKITKRFQLPKCQGQQVESSSCEWVRPKDKVEKLVICEECYFDKIAWTAIEDAFEYIPISKPISNSERMDYVFGHRSEPPTAWVCDAKIDAIISALDSSVKRQDPLVFSKAARTIMSTPACVAQGMSSETCFTLAGGAEEFDVCPAHFAGFFEAWGQDKFFEPKQPLVGEKRYLCNLHPSAPRYLQFMNKLFEAGQEGVWSRYADVVHKYATIPECAKEEHVPNRRWYGWQDCLICPDCFEAISGEDQAKNHPNEGTERDLAQTRPPADGLVQRMDVRNELIKEIRMCCMYSPRMRQKYSEAVERGNDPTELLEFSRQRHAVYARTVPHIKMLREMQQMQMMTAMSAGMAGLMYQGASSIQTISGSTDGYLHGNSQVGWHETENGATSAKLFNEMNSGFAGANSQGSWMQIAQLTTEWRQFE